MKPLIKYISFCLVFVIGLGMTALLLSSAKSSDKEKLDVHENIGGQFTLTNTEGKKVSLTDFQGKIILLNFGFTSCPDVCPVILGNIKQVLTRLGNASEKVQVLFITFDPERDTPKQLKAYLSAFGPKFIGLTGTEEEIKSVIKKFRGMFLKQEIDSELNYVFAHTDYVYLIDPQNRVRAFYSSNKDLNQIVSDIHQLIEDKG